MKTYNKPMTTTYALRVETMICTSPELKNEKGGTELTREQGRANGGFGSGLWEDMK